MLGKYVFLHAATWSRTQLQLRKLKRRHRKNRSKLRVQNKIITEKRTLRNLLPWILNAKSEKLQKMQHRLGTDLALLLLPKCDNIIVGEEYETNWIHATSANEIASTIMECLEKTCSSNNNEALLTIPHDNALQDLFISQLVLENEQDRRDMLVNLWEKHALTSDGKDKFLSTKASLFDRLAILSMSVLAKSEKKSSSAVRIGDAYSLVRRIEVLYRKTLLPEYKYIYEMCNKYEIDLPFMIEFDSHKKKIHLTNPFLYDLMLCKNRLYEKLRQRFVNRRIILLRKIYEKLFRHI